MALISSATTQISTRRLVAHKKSRKGCGNCKLRSVKCDESRPGCKRCTAYGVYCNYDRAFPELQFQVEKATAMKLPTAPFYWPSKDDQLITKFQMRTAFTIGTGERLRQLQNQVVTAAYSNPFLKHAILALTLMHDRHLSAIPNTVTSTSESYHWSQAISSFNRKLSSPVQQHEQVALMTTAALLGTIVFYNLDARCPEEAWPLRQPSSADLDWLKMNNGKKEVWKLTEPEDSDYLTHVVAAMYPNALLSGVTPMPAIEYVPPTFNSLFNLTSTSSPNTNPYHLAASGLAQIFDVDSPPVTTVVAFATFISTIQPSFKQLLEQKEPRALLLLACWYAKVCFLPVWWLSGRATIEGQAICLYLEKYHHHEIEIQMLLQLPKALLFLGMNSNNVETSQLFGIE